MAGKRRDYIDPEAAACIAADLPDGAYWCLMEELTGMEPAEVAFATDPSISGKKRRRKKRRNRRAA